MSLQKVTVASGALVKVQIDGTVEADSLSTTGAAVDVSAAAPGIAGDVLTLTTPTTATWQAPGGGGSDHPGGGTNSVVVPSTAVASGLEAVGLGYEVDATGDYSVALGSHAQAALESIAIGGGGSDAAAANASGNGSIAIGVDSLASTTNSTAVGYNAVAFTGTNASAFGNAAAASGDYSTALGTNTLASGANSIAVGGNSTSATAANATNTRSIAIGDDTQSSGTDSVALGAHCRATGVESIAIGGGSAIGSAADALQTDSIAIGGNSLANAVGAIALGNGVNNSTANALFTLSSLATLGSGTDLLFSGGQIAPLSSTKRIKEDVVDLPEATAKRLKLLRPRKFRLKHEDREALGLIAEEVAEVAPELAEWGHWRTLDENGQQTGEVEETLSPVGVRYREVSIALLAYVQQLEARVAALEAK